jgi:hypothetical protein
MQSVTYHHTRFISAVLILATALLFAQPVLARKKAPPITFSGSMLYRLETTWQDPGSDFVRHRMCARFGAVAQLHESLNATIRISTDGVPSSRNVTFGDAFDAKPIALDLGYLAWRPTGFIGSSEIRAGKMENPFYRPGGNQLLWSSDVTPEGLAAVIGMPARGAPGLFLNTGMFLIDQQQNDTDAALYAVQGGPRILLSELFGLKKRFTLTLGGGYYHYWGAEEKILGVDLKIAEALGDIEFTTRNYTFNVYGNLAINTAADNDDMAWIAGLDIARGPVSVAYSYRYIEANAVPEPLTDANFGSVVDSEGHVASVRWNVLPKVGLRYTVFVADASMSSPAGPGDFYRMQADVIVSF